MDRDPFGNLRLLLVTGKGGIGKSLFAAAIGQRAAEAGRRTLLVENAALDPLGPLFGKPPVGHADTPLGANLSVINLSPPENFRDYVVKYLGQPKLFDHVFKNNVVSSFVRAIPGLAEVMLLGRLYYELELRPPPRPDFLIFDGPASGHFLKLLTTPKALLGSTLGGPLSKETERVVEFLRRPEVGIAYVTVPEDLPVSECLDFLPVLATEAPARVAGVVVNRMLPKALAFGEGDTVSSYAAAHLARRYASEERALATLERGLAGMASKFKQELVRLPLAELGFVDEPLAPGFARRWLGGERGGEP